MSSAVLVVVRNPFHPLKDREQRAIEVGQSLAQIAPKVEARPFIVLRNGEAVLRADWDQEVGAGDIVAIVFLPQGGGGGGSNPLKIVLSIALMVVAPQIGAAVANSAFAAEMVMGSSFLTGSMISMAVSGAVSFAGNALINAMAGGGGSPKTTSNQLAVSAAAPSPTYNIQAQGNMARLEAAIPVQYGRIRCFPDFAAAPYTEFSSNEQYLYQLLCIGAGYYDIEAIQIEDTPIGSFEEVTTETIGPGQPVTLFPTNVVTVAEVTGQELLYNTPVGPFVINAAGTQINAISVDLVAPRGMYYANDEGELDTRSASVLFEYQAIDDNGTPTGAWTTLASHSISAATTTPQRVTHRHNVALGRYQIRATRDNTKDTSSRAGNDIDWAGVRGYIPAATTYGDVTLVAIRIRASNNISSQSARRINVICTRKVPTWTGSAWTAPIASSSIAWALADACTNTTWGAGLPESRVDLDGLLALDTTWAARGDEFNGRFDNTVSFWEAISKIARAGRAFPFMQGGVIRFSRDEAQTTPVALFSMRNIARGSFKVQYLTPSEVMADACDVTYFDDVAWMPRRVLSKLADSSAERPVKIEYFGVTNRAQAYREGLYEAACNRYRRKLITFATEQEGFIPSFGDLVAISHDMPRWGQGGDAIAWDGLTRTLTVSESLTWGAGTHYVGLRLRNGSLEGPISVTAGAEANQLVLATPPTFTPYTGGNEERTQIVFGEGESWRQLARVIAIRPRGTEQVLIECVNEDAEVHTVSGVPPAPAGSWGVTPAPTLPVISGLLLAVADGNVYSPSVSLSWPAAPGATSYYVEQSFDGLTFHRLGEVTTPNYTVATRPGTQWFRVAPMGAGRGAWVEWAGTITGAAAAADTPGQLVGLTSAVFQTTITIGWPAHGQPAIANIEIWRNTVNNSATATRIAVVQGDLLEYADTTGVSLTAFYYWVRAVNVRGVAGPMSASTTKTTEEVGGAGGVEVVDALPSVDNFEGRIVFLTTDDKLYRYTGSAWTSALAWSDVSSKPANVAALTGSEGINNAAISISAAGVLSGAGGGAVTPAGLNVTPITLTATGQCVVSGNKVTKSGGVAGWDSQAYSTFGYLGGAYVTFRPDQNNAYIMVGLNTDPTTDASYGSIDYAIYPDAAGGLSAYESGAGIGLGTYAAGDLLGVSYDGVWIRYHKNGSVLRTVAAPANNLTFYLDSSFYTPSGSVSQVQFMPMSCTSITVDKIAAGAVTADKIAANAVTADKILAGAVTAAKISTTNLAAINADMGAITAGSLNIGGKFIVDTSGNATIKSATSGQRVEIYNNVIKVYDSNGVLRVKLGDLAA